MRSPMGKRKIVKVIKRLINKSVADQKDPYLALLDLRNTPSQDIGYSAVQRIFGRRTKTLLPVSEGMLKPRYADKVKEQLHYRKGRETHYYNKGAKELPTLQEGDVVRVRPKGNEKSWKKAIVEGQVDIRSYNIRTEDGREYRRNRRHLRTSREHFARELSPSPKIESNSETYPNTGPSRVTNHDPATTSPVKPNRPVDEPDTALNKPSLTHQADPAVIVTRSGRVVKPPKRLQE